MFDDVCGQDFQQVDTWRSVKGGFLEDSPATASLLSENVSEDSAF